MNLKVLLVVISVIFIAACKKGVGGKQSNLTLTGVSTRSVVNLGTIAFNFEFSHPYSGTINDTLGIKINYKTCTYKHFDTTTMVVPVFNNTSNQICKMEYDYIFGGNGLFTTGCLDTATGNIKSDSCWFQFWLLDKNSISSDTISSPMIYLKQ